jgi:hypothetical protein
MKIHQNGLILESKTTLPGIEFDQNNPKEIINFYTQKLYTATNELEISFFLHQRGCVNFDIQEYELCENDFRESLKYNINNPLLYFDYCDLCCVLQRYEEGIQFAQKSIFLQSDFPLGLVQRKN